jgi:hypothetical protein
MVGALLCMAQCAALIAPYVLLAAIGASRMMVGNVLPNKCTHCA